MTSAKKLLSVGFELASKDVQYCNFQSDASLLDWDIVLFKSLGTKLTLVDPDAVADDGGGKCQECLVNFGLAVTADA